jgi:hypothetical protein
MAMASTKKKNPSWFEESNAKLYKLFQQRKANPKETTKKYIEPIRKEHFSHIPYRNFCVNFLKIREVGG